ncbi:hypothetical protein NC652_040348 [Populus alba x Populus x berolinensis]|nr:hypothetical protein NC652_040348 [Populus alba x Populus x berolinensis]
MADLYSTRKWIQNQQSDSLVGAAASGSITPATPLLPLELALTGVQVWWLAAFWMMMV